VEVLRREVADNSIQLTVTSPPYDNLRKYNGFEWDFEALARELYRVTKPGGVVVWVVADATISGSETGTSFRQALYFKECGFNLHDTMIYQKAGTGMAGSLKCYIQAFEYMFVFSRGLVSTVNILRDRANVRAGKINRNPARLDADGNRKPQREVVNAEFGRRLNIWRYGHSGVDVGHPAVFPEALAEDHIKSWSNPGDTVLDPFLGSGTTGKMAALAERSFIGVDISPEYVALAERRINEARA
jgi:site-specific DNA-methyltransferase (adenine-specific)